MGIYICKLPAGYAGMRQRGSVLVSAADATNAKDVAAAAFDVDANAAWAAITPTLVADVASNATGALLGYRFRVQISTPAGAELVDVEATGAGTDDTIDEIAALLVTALNATASIAGAAYNSTTQVLTVAETTDGIGDHTLTVTVRPPLGSTYLGADDSNLTGYNTAQTHEGAAGAALDVTFPADTYVRPTVLDTFDER
jgi:hypothetical protein